MLQIFVTSVLSSIATFIHPTYILHSVWTNRVYRLLKINNNFYDVFTFNIPKNVTEASEFITQPNTNASNKDSGEWNTWTYKNKIPWNVSVARSNRKASPCKLSQGRAQRSGSRFKADISCLAMDLEARNGTGGNDDEEYTNIYFIVGDRRETVTYKADQVTDMELKGKSI